ncbi:hypothetical protein Tco_0058681 [Tanacetum coccineum]
MSGEKDVSYAESGIPLLYSSQRHSLSVVQQALTNLSNVFPQRMMPRVSDSLEKTFKILIREICNCFQGCVNVPVPYVELVIFNQYVWISIILFDCDIKARLGEMMLERKSKDNLEKIEASRPTEDRSSTSRSSKEVLSENWKRRLFIECGSRMSCCDKSVKVWNVVLNVTKWELFACRECSGQEAQASSKCSHKCSASKIITGE